MHFNYSILSIMPQINLSIEMMLIFWAITKFSLKNLLKLNMTFCCSTKNDAKL